MSYKPFNYEENETLFEQDPFVDSTGPSHSSSSNPAFDLSKNDDKGSSQDRTGSFNSDDAEETSTLGYNHLSSGVHDPFADAIDPVLADMDHDESLQFLGPASYTDRYGNSYNHMDFDSRRYTSKLSFKGNRLVYFTSAFVSLFVSLFGYEQGVCLGILTYVTFRTYFHNPSATAIGLVISILEIGALFSSLGVARISEIYGRKRTILLGTAIFIVGGLLQSFCPNLWVFGVGRIFLGIGVGILLTIVPSYQCEISPSEDRGKLVCGEFTGNIVGYALSVWVDYFCYFIQDIGDARTNAHSFPAHLLWRLPLFIQVVIACVLFVGGLFIVELPRWLLDGDRDQLGFHLLCRLYDSDPNSNKPREEFFMIKNSIIHERKTVPKSERTWRFMFKHYTIRVFIGCSALAFAQFNGINIISYYAPMVFELAGFNDSKALLMTGINGLIYLASTIAPWFLVDRWGRKPILISGGISMALCLFAIAAILYADKSYTPGMVAFLVIVYNASFGYSWGPVGFLIPPEVYPLSVRSKGVSLSTASNWFANYVVGQMTPILQQSIGWVMYLFPAASCVLSAFVVWFYYPETKGIELEKIDELFAEYYGKQLYRERELASLDDQGIRDQSSFLNIELEDLEDRRR